MTYPNRIGTQSAALCNRSKRRQTKVIHIGLSFFRHGLSCHMKSKEKIKYWTALNTINILRLNAYVRRSTAVANPYKTGAMHLYASTHTDNTISIIIIASVQMNGCLKRAMVACCTFGHCGRTSQMVQWAHYFHSVRVRAHSVIITKTVCREWILISVQIIIVIIIIIRRHIFVHIGARSS